MKAFRLEKWYMDAVDPLGNALVAYSAKLSWSQFVFSYNGLTFSDARRKSSINKNTFSSQALPNFDGDILEWRLGEIRARWTKEVEALKEVLLATEDGSIDWDCFLPKGNVSFCVDNKTELHGMGYAEKMTLTIAPWSIPIKQLHWGRFLSQTFSVIWIRWIGPHPKTLIFLNHERFSEGTITESDVSFGDYTLSIQKKETLRQGTILSTVFDQFRSIGKLFPSSILNMKENKWVSNGILKHRETVLAQGNIIHELVTWA
jgi:hypothetical protein